MPSNPEMNIEAVRLASEVIRHELQINPDYRYAWVSSVESALRENLRAESTLRDVAVAIVNRLTGER